MFYGFASSSNNARRCHTNGISATDTKQKQKKQTAPKSPYSDDQIRYFRKLHEVEKLSKVDVCTKLKAEGINISYGTLVNILNYITRSNVSGSLYSKES